jgi:LPXTG-site transpeptidase (sortase) family protein
MQTERDMSNNQPRTSAFERVKDGTLDLLERLILRRPRGRRAALTSDVTQSSSVAQSALKTTTLEEHEGLAGAAMPTLPAGSAKSFYGKLALIAGVIIFSFFATALLLSQIQSNRDQQVALQEFRYSLANGTAPVSALGATNKLMTVGTSVAIIDIPKLSVHAVVVEGTTSQTTMRGPAHRRDTVMPGQVGVSVIFGRQFTYGAAFNGIGSLVAGDEITTVTGQGTSTYSVIGVRYTGDSLPTPPADKEGRLTLVSATGIPLFTSAVVRVDAKLVTEPKLTPILTITNAALPDNEEAMRGDAAAWPLLALTLVFLAGLIALFVLLRRFWGKWQTWIVAVPVLIAVGSFAATQILVLFPNLI